MIELLAVKAGREYCRFKDNSFEFCKMNKASVYPLLELDKVKKKLDMVKKVEPESVIIKMKITEEVVPEEEYETGLE